MVLRVAAVGKSAGSVAQPSLPIVCETPKNEKIVRVEKELSP